MKKKKIFSKNKRIITYSIIQFCINKNRIKYTNFTIIQKKTVNNQVVHNNHHINFIVLTVNAI